MASKSWLAVRDELLERQSDLQAIADQLGLGDLDTVIGKLTRFWKFASDNTATGILEFSTEVVDMYANCQGLCMALQHVGWCEIKEGSLVISLWHDQEQKKIKQRLQIAERVRRHRIRSREEKQAKKAAADAKKADAGKKLWGKKPVQFDPEAAEWHGITQVMRETWAKAYPLVSVDQELSKAAAWCIANPAQGRGRKENYSRFLSGWMSRCQERGGSSPEFYSNKQGPRQPQPKIMTAQELLAQELAQEQGNEKDDNENR